MTALVLIVVGLAPMTLRHP